MRRARVPLLGTPSLSARRNCRCLFYAGPLSAARRGRLDIVASRSSVDVMHPARKPWDNSTRTPSRPPSSATTPSRNVGGSGVRWLRRSPLDQQRRREGAFPSAASTPRTPRDARRKESVRVASAKWRSDDAPLTSTERTVLRGSPRCSRARPTRGDGDARRSFRDAHWRIVSETILALPRGRPRSVGALRRVLRDARELVSRRAPRARDARASSLRSRLVAERRRAAALERALGSSERTEPSEGPTRRGPNPERDQTFGGPTFDRAYPATGEDADAAPFTRRRVDNLHRKPSTTTRRKTFRVSRRGRRGVPSRRKRRRPRR